MTKRGTIRKRGLKGESRKVRNNRKELRNKGLEYNTKTGKNVKVKKSMLLVVCQNKCSEKVTDEVREILFEEYWGMGSYDRRISYIASLIEFTEPKRRRVRNDNGNNHFRQVTNHCKVEVQGKKVTVCRKCLLKIFDETPKTIETALVKKRASSSGIVQLDGRGDFPKSLLPENVVTQARYFLSKIPAYESHYSRRDCGKKLVSPHLTITSIYQECKGTLSQGE